MLPWVERGVLKDFIKDKWNTGNTVIIVGVVNLDMYAAAHSKSFLIGAGWVQCEEKVIRYGICAPLPKAMEAILMIIVNQSNWYYECILDDDTVPTRVVTLCSANTYSKSVPQDEREIAARFQAILKYGSNPPGIKQALMCHLMAGKRTTTCYMDRQVIYKGRLATSERHWRF